jgi:SHS2 domain-containing protein
MRAPRTSSAKRPSHSATCCASTRGGEPVTHRVSVSAADLPTLLVEWLEELVYLAENDEEGAWHARVVLDV